MFGCCSRSEAHFSSFRLIYSRPRIGRGTRILRRCSRGDLSQPVDVLVDVARAEVTISVERMATDAWPSIVDRTFGGVPCRTWTGDRPALGSRRLQTEIELGLTDVGKHAAPLLEQKPELGLGVR